MGPLLEAEFRPESQLAHGGPISNIRNARTIATVYAAIRQIEVDMVEDVKELKLELRFHFFGDAEVLEQRQIGIKEPRATQGIAPDISELV